MHRGMYYRAPITPVVDQDNVGCLTRSAAVVEAWLTALLCVGGLAMVTVSAALALCDLEQLDLVVTFVTGGRS